MSKVPTVEKPAPVEKVEAEKDKKANNKNKKATKPVDAIKFEGVGQNFKAKLIGFEDVNEPKGDIMCHVAMAKLKAAVIALGEHKEKIVFCVSFDGLSIYDEKRENLLHRHPINIVSYIARDVNDSRSFGYVVNDDSGKHRFCAVKTEKTADTAVTAIKELLQVYAERQAKPEESTDETATEAMTDPATVPAEAATVVDADVPKEENLLGSSSPVTENPPAPVLAESGVAKTSDGADVFGQNLLALDNGLLDLQLDPITPGPGYSQLQSPKQLNLDSLLMSDVFQAPPAKIEPQPQVGTPRNTNYPLSFSPVAYPRNAMPHQQQFATQQGLSGSDEQFSPIIQHQSVPQQAYQQFSLNQGNQFKPMMHAQNGWSSFDNGIGMPTQPQSTNPYYASPMNSPMSYGTPTQQQMMQYSFQQQNQQQQQQQQQMFSGSPNFQLNPNDPFADLSPLAKKHSNIIKRPTKDDFVKEPPKPTLLDLAGQRKESFGHPNNMPQQRHPLNNSVSFDAIGENDVSAYAEYADDFAVKYGEVNQASRQFQHNETISSLPENSVHPQLRMNHINRLQNRPVSIDFSSQRFSVFEDRRGMVQPPEINWFGASVEESPNTGSTPVPMARQRFLNK